ncbi:unnamed protein product [Protopolystoma xenopodis]|uniref:MAT1 centre domain-containing protein n=1 Tax=Protopolystoma xenopodis TaxID=117903 RepID=A0A3S5A5W1_9PLAT|nr:unnamed protein product [Protopolystoma xenopodis]
MVNTCGHPLCENCVEVLFVRGSGLCVQCKMPLRKANFRYQLFEDPLVQKEVELRKKILNDFNKREEDFDSLEEYDLYLEKIEQIIYNLVNDLEIEDTKRYVELYKRENKDLIKKNRAKLSYTAAFYATELEKEQLVKAELAREEASELNESRRTRLAKHEDALRSILPPSVLESTLTDNSPVTRST